MGDLVLFAQPGVAAWGILQWAIAVIVVAAVVAVVIVLLKHWGIVVPQFIITIAWICLAALIGVVAVKFIISLL